jgi:hypothetical protein
MKKITSVLHIIVAAILLAGLFEASLPLTLSLAVAISVLLSAFAGKGLSFAIVANIVDIRGKAYEPIIEELLFENDTVAQNLVAFETDVKSETIFTESDNTAVMQAYTCGLPTTAGGFNLDDTMVTPIKALYYTEFCPDNLRTSRFKRSMKAGAWNTASTEFERTVLASYGSLISLDAEDKFWSGISAGQKTAIAALTAGAGQGSVGAAEQAWAASATANAPGINGVISKMIYNNGAVGSRIKVLGTTITSANIGAEYAKVYAAIPALVMAGKVPPYMYVPRSHKQLINLFNLSQTYRNIFDVKGDKYYYLGTELKFVPIPDNCIIAARPDYLIWCTDLLSDLNKMEINKIAPNREDWFVKNIFTLAAHVVNQKYNVLYLG